MLQQFFSNLWCWKCGLPESGTGAGTGAGFDELKETEWNADFEQYMRNRLIFGAMRYGRLGAKNKPKYDRVKDMIRRLKEYEVDRNSEHLVDVANICMCEFVEGDNTFKPIDDGRHTNVSNM